VFDFVIALLCLFVLSPILLLIGLLVRLLLGTPILFVQERAGFQGRPFRIAKFRSMTDRRDVKGNLLPDWKRLTAFGALLRASSLDELPELWNVVRGDMSLVGPRPLLMEYLPLYNERQARRHEVRPGLTGLAQVSGRNELSWEEKFEYDVWYVDHHSFIVDLRILWRSVLIVLRRDGVSQRGHATAEKFRGSDR